MLPMVLNYNLNSINVILNYNLSIYWSSFLQLIFIYGWNCFFVIKIGNIKFSCETCYITPLHKQQQTFWFTNTIVCINIQCWKIQYLYEYFCWSMVLSSGMYCISLMLN